MNIFFCLDARSYCLKRNSDLLSIRTLKIAQYIQTRLSSIGSYWIGLSERDYPNKFYWSDGSPVSYFGWSGYVSSYSMLLFLLFLKRLSLYIYCLHITLLYTSKPSKRSFHFSRPFFLFFIYIFSRSDFNLGKKIFLCVVVSQRIK